MTALRRYALRIGATAALAAGVSFLSASASTATTTYPTKTYANLVYTQSTQKTPVTLDVNRPVGDKKLAPVMIVVHGGGFDTGDAKSVAPYALSMAAEGFVTVNVNYTLDSPTMAGYPEQVNEIQAAVTWTIAHISHYGGNPRRIALVGFSAGGYLSAMAGVLESNLPGRPVQAVVTLSAPLDLPALDQQIKNRIAVCGYKPTCAQDPMEPPAAFKILYDFLGCPTGKCSSQLLKSASPSDHVTKKSPPFLMYNSSDELIPRDQPYEMGHILHASGILEKVVILPGSQHGAAYLPEVSTPILQFLDTKLGLPASGASLPIVSSSAPPATGSTSTVPLVAGCAFVVAASLVAILLMARRRRVGPS